MLRRHARHVASLDRLRALGYQDCDPLSHGAVAVRATFEVMFGRSFHPLANYALCSWETLTEDEEVIMVQRAVQLRSMCQRDVQREAHSAAERAAVAHWRKQQPCGRGELVCNGTRVLSDTSTRTTSLITGSWARSLYATRRQSRTRPTMTDCATRLAAACGVVCATGCSVRRGGGVGGGDGCERDLSLEDVDRKGKRVLVRWVGFTQPSWQPMSDFSDEDLDEFIAAWERERRPKRRG